MTSARHVAHALRRELNGRQFVNAPWQWGVVHAAHTSPNTVDLYLDGATTLTPGVRYVKSYAPTVGDTVLVGRYGSDRFVVGVLA